LTGDSDADRDAVDSLESEDRARANTYGLISRLFFAPADPNLLAEICGGGAPEGELLLS
jgi:hypothetical protein